MFLSISLIGIGLGMLRVNELYSALGNAGAALIGVGICMPVGCLEKRNNGTMRWAFYGVASAMVIVWFPFWWMIL